MLYIPTCDRCHVELPAYELPIEIAINVRFLCSGCLTPADLDELEISTRPLTVRLGSRS